MGIELFLSFFVERDGTARYCTVSILQMVDGWMDGWKTEKKISFATEGKQGFKQHRPAGGGEQCGAVQPTALPLKSSS